MPTVPLHVYSESRVCAVSFITVTNTVELVCTVCTKVNMVTVVGITTTPSHLQKWPSWCASNSASSWSWYTALQYGNRHRSSRSAGCAGLAADEAAGGHATAT